ncbi:hypothetical protein KUW09_07270 [Mameliella alba]|nr:hypothetical protein [Antarctobacter heliothermus]MBY6143835.1 hypothetical protein [Mameliella alba]MCA0953885.1 hypothetical protein [Mameliella alba]
MMTNITTPIIVAYIEGLRKMLADGDQAGVISSIDALNDLENIPEDLHAMYVQGLASIGQA